MYLDMAACVFGISGLVYLIFGIIKIIAPSSLD